MTAKVFAFIEKHQMIEKGDLVILGVSGGADSLCLLFLLLEYRKKMDFTPAVVHVNHGLRKEAGEEAEYVERICKENKIPFLLVEAKVKEFSKEKKISEEEAGRLLRYRAFEEAGQCFDSEGLYKKKIAVAHHGNDQAETLLFHLFRGTGIYGMAGILPKREQIIRPLLCLSRREIESYLEQQKIVWCNDASNEEDDYTRNKIRHHILGYAASHINEKAADHVAQAAMQMREIREYLEEEVEKAKAVCCNKEGEGIRVSLPLFFKFHPLIQKQLLLAILNELLPGRKDVGSVHISMILDLCKKEGSKDLMLPFSLRVKKEYENLFFYQKEDVKEVSKEEQKEQEIRPEESGSYRISEEETLEVKVFPVKELLFSVVLEENQYTKFLDYDKIKNCLSLRCRQTGDYIVINDKGQKKKLKEFMIEEKIPRDKRDRIPVIAEGAHVLWIMGYRISAYYKVSKDTKNIIQMTIRRREEHGRKS